MTTIDRGVCPKTGKARFTHDEAVDKVRRAKLRGHVQTFYRCHYCAGWWHMTHANGDDRGGGVRRGKKRLPTAAQRRAKGRRR